MADAESRGELWGEDKPAPVRLFWAINSLAMVCRNLAAAYERFGEHEKLPSPTKRDYWIGQVTELLPKVDEMRDRVCSATHAGGTVLLDEALNPGAKSQQLALLSLVHKVRLTTGSVEVGMIEDLYAQACMGNDVDALRRLGGELNTINEQLRAAMEVERLDPFRSTPESNSQEDGDVQKNDAGETPSGLDVVLCERAAELLADLAKQGTARPRTYFVATLPADKESLSDWVNELLDYKLVEDRGKHKGIAILPAGREWLNHHAE